MVQSGDSRGASSDAETLTSGPVGDPLAVRFRRLLVRTWARVRWRRPSVRARLASALVVLLAAALITISAKTSGGQDLRPTRNSDVIDLVQAQGAHNKALAAQVAQLQAQVAQLSGAAASASPPAGRKDAEAASGATVVRGPGVKVTLNDAPLSVQPADVDPDMLVVHQQDIQTFTNVLWRAGAEAMTVQGQRVGPNTSIKCVGNTVIVQGVPYAPPYVIEAIGDPTAMLSALAADPNAIIYRQYVSAYGLGYDAAALPSITAPAWGAPAGLRYATPQR